MVGRLVIGKLCTRKEKNTNDTNKAVSLDDNTNINNTNEAVSLDAVPEQQVFFAGCSLQVAD